MQQKLLSILTYHPFAAEETGFDKQTTGDRRGTPETTNETDIKVAVNLAGSGKPQIDTGV